MEFRSNMHARDASGNRVSLLNADAAAPVADNSNNHKMARQSSAESSAPSPPSMIFSDAVDVPKSRDTTPRTPISPQVITDDDAQGVDDVANTMDVKERRPDHTGYSSQQYPEYAQMIQRQQARYAQPIEITSSNPFAQAQRLQYRPSMQSTLHEHLPPMRADTYTSLQNQRPPFSPSNGPHHPMPAPTQVPASANTITPQQDGQAKRFPCRYAKSHNCDKTFTTSGHASRHAKIHTAEKGILCSYDGCGKKFTRNDNMKQHLETHKSKKNPENPRAEKKRKVRVMRGSQQASRSRSSTPERSPTVQLTNPQLPAFHSSYSTHLSSPNMQFSSFSTNQHSTYGTYDPRMQSSSVGTPPALALALHQAAVADAEDALNSSSMVSVGNKPSAIGRDAPKQPTAMDEEAAAEGLVGLNGHFN